MAGYVTDNVLGGKYVSSPYPHCLVRELNSNQPVPGAFYDGPAIGEILNLKSFDQFTRRLEYGPHNQVHTRVGGEQGDLSFMHSPNDPIFWLHHGYLDHVYDLWQKRNQRD